MARRSRAETPETASRETAEGDDEMNPNQVNADLNMLLQRIDVIAKAPYDSKKIECRNNLVEYNRLRELFLTKCLDAFRDGLTFQDTAP